MKVTVTQFHIDKAKYNMIQSPKNPELHCPITLAIKGNCLVGYSVINIEGREFALPMNVEVWLRHFDDAYDVDPIIFEL